MLSSRVGFAVAALLLLLAAGLRLWQITTLPEGLHQEEINDLLITEAARQGRIEVLYDPTRLGIDATPREGLYPVILAAVTSLTGSSGILGSHLLSVWVNLLALAMVYALVSRLYSPLAGVAALGLLTVNMWHILGGREISREALLPALVTAVMLMLARGLSLYREYHARLPLTTPFAALGLLLGLGFYIHPTHFMIVLASMVLIAYMILARKPVPHRNYLTFSLLIMIIVAMPYVISSLRLPELAGSGRVFEGYQAAQTPPLEALVRGLNGILFRGDTSPVRNLPGRPLLDLVSGLILLTGILVALRDWRKPRHLLPLLMLTALLLPAFLKADNPNFQGYLALLPVLALFFGLGLSTLVVSFRKNGLRLVWLALLAGAVFNLVWTGRDLFTVWPELEAVQTAYHTRIGQIAHYLDQTAGDVPTVVCVPGLREPETGAMPDNLVLLYLMLNRQNIPFRFADCGTGLVFAGGGAGEQVIFLEPDALDKVHPYLQTWLAQGEIINQPGIPRDAVVRLNVEQVLADRVGAFTTTAPAQFAPEVAGDDSMVLPPVAFGGNVAFLGYELLEKGAYPPGGIVTAVTYWRVDGETPPDLQFFTHILADPGAAPVAQTDTVSVSVPSLQDRDVFIQVTFIPLPESLPAGEYRVSIGAYQTGGEGRMPVLQDGQPRGDRLFLGSIQVAQEQDS
ncbi:MAG: glycosyltransferase family 39 protein [Anaerolineaceae bacterium]|nr:glycosyltransferase family 39 protein [Anaerolineaceae bacterium]